MIIGRDLVDYYYEDERLYSTGDSELDDLLEKAFCDGYEYAQYEFSEDEDDQKKDDKNKKSGVGKKILKGAGIAAGTAAALTASYYGGRALQRRGVDRRLDKAKKEGLVGLPLANLQERRDKVWTDNALDRFGKKVAGGVKNIFTRKKTEA